MSSFCLGTVMEPDAADAVQPGCPAMTLSGSPGLGPTSGFANAWDGDVHTHFEWNSGNVDAEGRKGVTQATFASETMIHAISFYAHASLADDDPMTTMTGGVFFGQHKQRQAVLRIALTDFN